MKNNIIHEFCSSWEHVSDEKLRCAIKSNLIGFYVGLELENMEGRVGGREEGGGDMVCSTRCS